MTARESRRQVAAIVRAIRESGEYPDRTLTDRKAAK